MDKWKTKELLIILEKELCEKDYRDLELALKSLYRKIGIFYYHQSEYEKIVKIIIRDKENIPEVTYKLLCASAGEDNEPYFYEQIFKAEAHAIACAHSLHSAIDNLGYIIAISLDIKKQFSSDSQIDFKKIANNKIKRCPVLYEHCQELLNSKEFKYIEAFINKVKHQMLIETTYSISFEKQKHGLFISSFFYKGDEKARKPVDAFLMGDCVNLINKIIIIGNEINISISNRDKSAFIE